ncbi:DnaB-like helicase N-terminal domain-containing protein [Nocardioides sp. SOB77]|uniref:DnaB-like helicase N-terminal domain-containing protein n=1 Tax=Nocardioides oceani TaxID=3058369 RepID=A0ABT8FGW8_9ACTN|nr:DnaB-like helicase N-terminal domain-containing protein [Nocardioides oceani]MDN4173943.1 DnaB-like helicase N-terminal domain-containing protein [Nocardioides oceani]
MTHDGPPSRHLHPVEPPFDPEYDRPPTTGGRPAPGDRAAEQAVLAALLATPDPDGGHPGERLATILETNDFYWPIHQRLWDTWHQLHQQHAVPPDLVTLNARLVANRDTDAARALADLIGLPTNPALAEHHANIVRDTSRLRVVGDLGQGLTQIATTGRVDDIDHYLGEALQRLDETVVRFGSRTSITTPTTWSPVDLEQVLAGEYLDPPPTMLMRSDGVFLFYDGAVHTVSGESESGKTWLTLLAATQLMAASENVTFLDFEDRADRVIGRLLALGATPDQIRNHFTYVRPDRPLDDGGRTQFEPAITNARLVVLDGVTEAMTLHGFDLNSNEDSAHFQGLLPRWIADHGPAVVMIDHVVKDKEKQDRFALGAQHKLAGIDGAAYIVKMLQPFGRGKRGLASVQVAKDRPGHVRGSAFGNKIAEFTLDATASDVVLVAHLLPPGEDSGRKGDTFEPTIVMERISRYVQANPGMSKKSVEGAMNGKATTIRLALELLVARGYIHAKAESRGKVAHYHLKPFYADGDPSLDTVDDHTDDATDGPANTTSTDPGEAS